MCASISCCLSPDGAFLRGVHPGALSKKRESHSILFKTCALKTELIQFLKKKFRSAVLELNFTKIAKDLKNGAAKHALH
jgi:hypothetical protein